LILFRYVIPAPKVQTLSQKVLIEGASHDQTQNKGVLGRPHFVLLQSLSLAQQDLPDVPNQPGITLAGYSDGSQVESRRLHGLIPNYRTSPSPQNYEPLTSCEKFKIASEDAFDRDTIGLAAVFGAQLAKTNRSFGQVGAGFWQVRQSRSRTSPLGIT